MTCPVGLICINLHSILIGRAGSITVFIVGNPYAVSISESTCVAFFSIAGVGGDNFPA